MFRKFFCGVLLLATVTTTVEAQVQDTIFVKSPLFTGKDAVLLGAFTLGAALVAPIDREVASRLQYPGAQENQVLRRAATGFRILAVPGSLIAGAGLYALGRIDKQPRVQSLGLHSVESILIADIVGGAIKMVAGRQRPYVDIDKPYDFQLWRGFKGHQFQSFPSGHTINAFAFASTVTRETQFWWPHAGLYVGTVFYGGATLMGLSRIYNNQHWASDVMAGAAIGTVIGLKVVKYTHSHTDNTLDKKLIRPRNTKMVPTPLVFTIKF
ncbi:MAG TPA: phosphatase PAP2 family protein [Gemmatimonadaceae bacterium]|nr:phosphatase PAP2 family protein [Gemmatimonadaceae bacterium]